MRTRDLERLQSLLLQLHNESYGDGPLRDEISHVRFVVDELIFDAERASR